jgi:Flp pilus assembly protein TadG
LACRKRKTTIAGGRGGLPALVRRVCGEDGSIVIETAIGFMLTMTMVLGIIECCMMAYTYSVLEDATREGVRYAAVHGADSSACSGPSTGCADSAAANVVTDVTTYAGQMAGNLSGMSVTVTYPDGACTATSRVQVAIAYTYQPIFHYPGATHLLTVSSQGRLVY